MCGIKYRFLLSFTRLPKSFLKCRQFTELSIYTHLDSNDDPRHPSIHYPLFRARTFTFTLDTNIQWYTDIWNRHRHTFYYFIRDQNDVLYQINTFHSFNHDQIEVWYQIYKSVPNTHNLFIWPWSEWCTARNVNNLMNLSIQPWPVWDTVSNIHVKNNINKT